MSTFKTNKLIRGSLWSFYSCSYWAKFPVYMRSCVDFTGPERNKDLQVKSLQRHRWPLCFMISLSLSANAHAQILIHAEKALYNNQKLAHTLTAVREVFYMHGLRWAGLAERRCCYQPQTTQVTANNNSNNNWGNLKLNCSKLSFFFRLLFDAVHQL